MRFVEQHVLLAVVFVAVGMLLAYLARSIRRGNLKILAGYDAAKVTDSAGLATWTGGSLLMLGLLQMAAGVLALFNIQVGGVAFFLATLLMVGRTVTGSRRFQR